MEKVDIVNKENHKVKITTKEDAHTKGLLHRTVIAELRDSKKNWMFVKQASYKQDKGKYVSPMGGHVKADETVKEALKREVSEELGISDFKYTYKGKFIFNRKANGHIENHYFIVYEIYTDAEPILNKESVGYVRLSTKILKSKLKSKPEMFGDSLIQVFSHLYPEIVK